MFEVGQEVIVTVGITRLDIDGIQMFDIPATIVALAEQDNQARVVQMYQVEWGDVNDLPPYVQDDLIVSRIYAGEQIRAA